MMAFLIILLIGFVGFKLLANAQQVAGKKKA